MKGVHASTLRRKHTSTILKNDSKAHSIFLLMINTTLFILCAVFLTAVMYAFKYQKLACIKYTE